MRHVLDVLVIDNSSILVADSENVYKNFIDRLTPHRIEKDLLDALDPDIAKLYQIGSLDFDTLQPLDHSKAERCNWPGIALHVVYDEEHYGISWFICEASLHLNRASPLRPKYNRKGVDEGNVETAIELRLGAKDLLLSHDPDIRAYFERRQGFYNLPMWRKLEGLRRGRTIQEQTHFRDITLMHRKHQTFENSDLARDADPEKGDVTEIWIQCSICKHANTTRLDRARYMMDFMFGAG
ncbi:uncharacterized protein LY89DRAFT_669036 [Mollisia scopiformis]|uniref:Uncharacterized protein n=1 Tax=Mollisia scopiformis TaxID=149040 RepID=A0A194XC53_MOLSC|nr:uncharacterized protein LY89DRAFT_669036 [Mollisia scopiformis]KUJ17745.1 hypothetical protein LY89DRAFT_669036 [Mollisia scopiformis]